MKLARQFVVFLWSAARWQLLWALALSTVLSLTEGISIAMIFPVIALLGDPGKASGAAGKHTQIVFSMLAATHLPRGAWLPALLVGVVAVVGMLTQLNGVFSTLSVSIILKVRLALARRLFSAILHADWTFLTARRSSDLTHLLTEELNRAGLLASNFVALLANGMVSLLMLGVAIYLAPQLTLIVGCCFVLMLPFQRRSSRAIHAFGDRQSLHFRSVFDSAMERLQNLKVVKAYGAQDAELELFSKRYGEAMDGLLQSEWRRNLASRRFQLVSLGLLCAVILAGLGWLHLPAATILLFLFAFVRATPRLNTVQAKVNDILSDLPAYRQIVQFMAECNLHSEREEQVGTAPLLERGLELRNVTFAYTPSAPPVLKELNLTLPVGRITAISGLSGAGKSTIADLMMGLLLPQSGVVSADDVPITRGNARAWRSRVGYVSQDTLLFHASIRENLLWARPGASDGEIAEALERARASFVHDLPRGLDTPVGDRGLMLSHGQRQRIALARAFLLSPSLLILDEATNSLDLENEEAILRTVLDEGERLTTLLISHRPSALQVAHRVYVIEDGRVLLRSVEARGGSDMGIPSMP